MPLREIERLKLDYEKCCIFTRDGELLWRSSAWGQPPNCEHDVLGTRWQEFVCDLPRVLRWLDNGKQHTITFHALLPSVGKHAIVTYAKARLGKNWLVFGEATIVGGQLPAPPCMAPAALNPPAEPHKTP